MATSRIFRWNGYLFVQRYNSLLTLCMQMPTHLTSSGWWWRCCATTNRPRDPFITHQTWSWSNSDSPLPRFSTWLAFLVIICVCLVYSHWLLYRYSTVQLGRDLADRFSRQKVIEIDITLLSAQNTWCEHNKTVNCLKACRQQNYTGYMYKYY